jgi:phage/plasmid-like protein (TIGR03299 family)
MTDRINQVLDQTGLNWTVREEDIQTASGIIISDKKAIVRNDNNSVLAVHGNGYQPYQNHQLIELLDKVSQQIGLPIHRGGSFGNGEKVFIQLKSEDFKMGNDRIEGYITGVNSFDGSTSLAFGPSNITISCMNKFFAAFRNLDTKVRHTKNMVMRIDEICRGLENVLQEEKELFANIERLSDIRIGEKDQDWVSRILFNIEKDVDLNKIDDLSTVTRNKLTQFYVDLNGELKGKGDNLWGLFSGVTKYTTHSMNRGNVIQNEQNKMFSTYGQRERLIFDKLVELV